ncbi:MAG: class I SAM-dependent methyltransferase [Bacteroidetes bacterium]|nr:class I SAM-dependent methyltransferase [Bacteroidota bacterium]
MACRQCEGIEQIFNSKKARKQLKRYRKKGGIKSTKLLIEAIRVQGVKNLSLLDIGGGVGAIQNALLNDGLEKVTSVDASSGYIGVAKEEAIAQKHDNKITWHHGNFTEVHEKIESADIVTLDRVVCCFDDMPLLVSSSLNKADQYYGLVFPNDSWIAKVISGVGTLFLSLIRSPFRSYIHSVSKIQELITSAGFENVYWAKANVWIVALYKKRSG